MKDYGTIRHRYLHDALPIRLGGLAANLLRVRSLMANARNQPVVEGLLEETKLFIEWTAAETDWDTAAELVELQVLLAGWQQAGAALWTDATQREQTALSAQNWSERVLELSGLLDA